MSYTDHDYVSTQGQWCDLKLIWRTKLKSKITQFDVPGRFLANYHRVAFYHDVY